MFLVMRVFRKGGYRFCEQNTRQVNVEHFPTTGSRLAENALRSARGRINGHHISLKLPAFSSSFKHREPRRRN
jgi:hypothetical protein